MLTKLTVAAVATTSDTPGNVVTTVWGFSGDLSVLFPLFTICTLNAQCSFSYVGNLFRQHKLFKKKILFSVCCHDFISALMRYNSRYMKAVYHDGSVKIKNTFAVPSLKNTNVYPFNTATE